MENTPKDAILAGATTVNETINETLKYSCATVEYGGLVSFSYLKRGGSFVYEPVSKVTAPVCDAAVNAYKKTAGSIGWTYDKTAGGLGWTYDKAADGFGKLLKAIPFPGRKMREVEERLQKIEEWMANIEKNGLVMAPSVEKGIKKKLSEEKEALLKNILLDNMDLKGI